MQESVGGPEDAENKQDVLVDAIESCKRLHLESYRLDNGLTGSKRQDAHDFKIALARARKYKHPLDLLSEVMERNASNLTYKVLHSYLTLRPYPDTHQMLRLLRSFGDSHCATKTEIDKLRQLFDIALRRALLRKEFDLAYELVDLSAGANFNISADFSSNRHLMLSAGAFSTMATGSIMLLSELWHVTWPVALGSVGVVYFYQLSRLLNALSTKSRVYGRSLLFPVSWKRLQTSYQTDLVNRIAVEYDELVDLTVDNYHQFAHSEPAQNTDPAFEQAISKAMASVDILQRAQLRKRRMGYVETEKELMFNEYWNHAGEGFEWVEPDQDPADQVIKTLREKT